jgi:hypothetical protein
MKGVWALLPLFASSGCLFLDTLNHPPTMTIRDDLRSATLGTPLMVHVDPDDPEDGPNTVPVIFSVDAMDGLPFDRFCDVDEHPSGRDYTVTFYRVGTFQVTIEATDSDHLMTREHVVLTVTRAKPMFTGNGTAAQSSSHDICGNNTAGNPITVHLDGAVTDAGAGLHASSGCSAAETLSYTWRVTDWPGGSKPTLTLFDGSTCATPTAASGKTLVVPDTLMHVCLWTDPTLYSGVGMYSVVLDASDGTTLVTSGAANITVGPDQPPCITGTEPVAGSYVVDRTQPQTFYVDGAIDDSDAFNAGITYAWSVYRAADGMWTDVPDYNLSTYTLDLASFGVGEKLEVRVEALDRTLRRVPANTCAPDVDDCTVSSCAAGMNACHKWKTWDLELR